jgi:hypothetical protein
MNPVTLDFVRGFRWLLVVQFVGTAIGWTMHAAHTGARVHLEILVALVLSWQLTLGVVRTHLAFPQSRAEVARGLWFSVVVVGWAVQCSGMAVGAGLAFLSGRPVLPHVLAVHGAVSLLLVGTLQFLLTSHRLFLNLTGVLAKVAAGVLGAMFGVSMWCVAMSALAIPDRFRDVTTLEIAGLVVLAALSIASWFTTQAMVNQSATPRGSTASARDADARFLSRAAGRWRPLLVQEWRWQLPVIVRGGSILLFIFGFGMLAGRGGGTLAPGLAYHPGHISRLMAVTTRPVEMTMIGTLRLLRTMPISRTACAVLTALRPVLACFVLLACSSLVQFLCQVALLPRTGDLGVVLFMCSLFSLIQAVFMRWSAILVIIVTVAVLTWFCTQGLPVMADAIGLGWMFAASGLVLALSIALHRRWLSSASGHLRGHPWLQRGIGADGV